MSSTYPPCPSNHDRTIPRRLEVSKLNSLRFKIVIPVTMTCLILISETHIHNPNWPPHARYHNGQTMSLGLFTGLISIYILHVYSPASSDIRSANLTWIAILHTLYYGSSLSGILYPGAGWMDPEFGEESPQLYGFPVLIGLVWTGWWFESRRITAQSAGGRGVKTA
jgi:hypothetical protein